MRVTPDVPELAPRPEVQRKKESRGVGAIFWRNLPGPVREFLGSTGELFMSGPLGPVFSFLRYNMAGQWLAIAMVSVGGAWGLLQVLDWMTPKRPKSAKNMAYAMSKRPAISKEDLPTHEGMVGNIPAIYTWNDGKGGAGAGSASADGAAGDGEGGDGDGADGAGAPGDGKDGKEGELAAKDALLASAAGGLGGLGSGGPGRLKPMEGFFGKGGGSAGGGAMGGSGAAGGGGAAGGLGARGGGGAQGGSAAAGGRANLKGGKGGKITAMRIGARGQVMGRGGRTQGIGSTARQQLLSAHQLSQAGAATTGEQSAGLAQAAFGPSIGGGGINAGTGGAGVMPGGSSGPGGTGTGSPSPSGMGQPFSDAELGGAGGGAATETDLDGMLGASRNMTPYQGMTEGARQLLDQARRMRRQALMMAIMGAVFMIGGMIAMRIASGRPDVIALRNKVTVLRSMLGTVRGGGEAMWGNEPLDENKIQDMIRDGQRDVAAAVPWWAQLAKIAIIAGIAMTIGALVMRSMANSMVRQAQGMADGIQNMFSQEQQRDLIRSIAQCNSRPVDDVARGYPAACGYKDQMTSQELRDYVTCIDRLLADYRQSCNPRQF